MKIFCASLLLAFVHLNAHALTEQLFDQVRPSVVDLQIVNSTTGAVLASATGFVAHKPTWVVSNFHAVASHVMGYEKFPTHVVAHGVKGQRRVMQVIAVDVHSDLAILQTDIGFQGSPLKLNTEDTAIGQRGYSFGNPNRTGISIVEGLFNNYIGFSRKTQLFAGQISHGMSGGPVIDREGVVRGINVALVRSMPGMTYVIPAQKLQALFEDTEESTDEFSPRDLATYQVHHLTTSIADFVPSSSNKQNIGNFSAPTKYCSSNNLHKDTDWFRATEWECMLTGSLSFTSALDVAESSYKIKNFNTDRLGGIGSRTLMSKHFKDFMSELELVKTEHYGPWRCTSHRSKNSQGLNFRYRWCERAILLLDNLFEVHVHAKGPKHGNEQLLVGMSLRGYTKEDAKKIWNRIAERIGVNK